MDLKYYENNLVEARLTCELVKEGAEVAIMSRGNDYSF